MDGLKWRWRVGAAANVFVATGNIDISKDRSVAASRRSEAPESVAVEYRTT